MTDRDRPRLAQVLALLGETFGEAVSELRAEAYFVALGAEPIDAVEMAARCSLTGKFFPRPGELLAVIHGSDEDAASLAWSDMLREIRRVGYLGEPQLPEATLETVRGIWGTWAHLCSTLPGEGPELVGWMKQWETAYGATKHRIERPELIGRDDAKRLVGAILQWPKEVKRDAIPE